MSLKTKTTSKLFYRKWVYKVVVTCGGINHLHRRGMDYVKDVIPQGSMWNGSSHYTKTVFDNKATLLKIGAFLETTLADKEYQIRAESCNAAIFTNDKLLVDTITNGLTEFVSEVYVPANLDHATFLANNKHKIICNELPHDSYRFKIYFKNGRSPSSTFMENFLTWAEKFNDGRIHIPRGTERLLKGEAHPYFYGHYFYARDEKIASMALMFMGDFLNKTEEFVLKSEVV